MAHASMSEILATPFRRLADMTDPEQAVEAVSRMLLTSPGGPSIVVNGTQYEVRKVTATTFHETGYWTNAAGEKITSGPYSPEGYTTYHPYLLLIANREILTNIPSDQALPRHAVRRLSFARPEAATRLVNDLPDIAAELYERYMASRSTTSSRRSEAHQRIDAIAQKTEGNNSAAGLEA